MILPTASSSPICAQGIVMNIFSPPEDQHSMKSSLPRGPSSVISLWESDKGQFLRKTSLSRVTSSNPEIRPQLTESSTVPIPSKWSDMFISKQNPLECQLSNSFLSGTDTGTLCLSGSGSTALSQCLSSSSSPRKKPIDTSNRRCPPFDHSIFSLNPEVADRKDELRAIDSNHSSQLQAGNSVTGDNIEDSTRITITWDETLRATFEPVQYPFNALSAASGFLSDPPHFSRTPTRMVPIPLFIDTLSKPLSRISAVQEPRTNLLPYPDLFDFAMYSSRVSREVDPAFHSSFPSDLTLQSPPTAPTAPEVTCLGHHNVNIVSRLTGLCTPPSTSRIVRKSHVSRDHRYPISEISMSSIALNSSVRLSPTFARTFNDVPRSPDISGEWNIISSDEISARLRAACEDLSRCTWTEEEFLKIIS